MKRFLLLALVAGLVAASAAAGGSASPVNHAPRIKGATNSTSTNWSGYAVTGATFADVKGSWVQPTANCSSTAASPSNGKGNGHGNGHGGGGGGASQSTYSSFWVGLDGYSSGTVEQTGTDADCSGTTPVYYGWYEFYPAFPVNLSEPVKPGDTMNAEVSVAGGIVTTTLQDATQGWTKQATQSSAGYAFSSAEWIAEAPSSGKVLPLADFGTVNFSNASATATNGRPRAIDAFTYDPITMVTSSGQTKAAPSGLSGGTAFSVTWFHS